MIGLEFIRGQFGLSMQDLALKLGVSRQTIHQWESQQIKISQKRLNQLSEIFGLKADYFQKVLTDIEELEVKKRKLIKEDEVDIHEIPFEDSEGMQNIFIHYEYKNEPIVKEMDKQILMKKIIQKFYEVVIDKQYDLYDDKSIEKLDSLARILDDKDLIENKILNLFLEIYLEKKKQRTLAVTTKESYLKYKETQKKRVEELKDIIFIFGEDI